jgi:hypothetical protein
MATELRNMHVIRYMYKMRYECDVVHNAEQLVFFASALHLITE